MQSRLVSRPLAVAIAAVCWLLLAPTAPAQVGLGDVGAATAIREDLESRQLGRNRDAAQPNQPAEAAAPAAGDAEAAPAPKPKKKLDKWGDDHSILRLDSPSAAWPKLLLVIGVFLAWVRSGDWVYRDATIYELGVEKWPGIVAGPFALGLLAIVLVPNFWIGFAVMLLTWAVPFFVYVGHHNSSVEKHQSVFTPGWFRFQVAEAGKLVGLKIGAEKRADYLRGPSVDLEARGGDERSNQANLLTARQSPGYVHVKELIADMTARGASRAMMDYGPEAVTTRYLIDGVWHNGEARDRESGDVTLAVMKQLSDLNVSERVKKQQGEFGAVYQKQKYDCHLASQGVKTGERVLVSLKGVGLKSDFKTWQQIGMRDKLREQWLEIMGSDRGVIVFAAMPEGGLTTTIDVSLLETDRLMRDFMAIEDKADPQLDIENIEAHYYDAAAGQSPATLIPSLSRKYPNVYVCRDLVDAESAKLLMDEVDLDRVVITSVHAKEAVEACLRVLKKKMPHKEFARDLKGVIAVKLIRKLCDACRVAYTPTPEMLKKLGIPAGKVEQLYRSPKPEEVDKPCKECGGIGFRGRTALFELLVPDAQFRSALVKTPKMDILRKTAREAGMRTMQEEGVLLVARGVTSVPELSRVLKA